MRRQRRRETTRDLCGAQIDHNLCNVLHACASNGCNLHHHKWNDPMQWYGDSESNSRNECARLARKGNRERRRANKLNSSNFTENKKWETWTATRKGRFNEIWMDAHSWPAVPSRSGLNAFRGALITQWVRFSFPRSFPRHSFHFRPIVKVVQSQLEDFEAE